MTTVETTTFKCIEWVDETVRLIDQTRLPSEEVWLTLHDYKEVVTAIKTMQVRGAPAIAIAGVYALLLAAREFVERQDFRQKVLEAAEYIVNARTTGANLAWAIDRMVGTMKANETSTQIVKTLTAEALIIQREDEYANRRISELGASILPDGIAILTHCNTGVLATSAYGTALGVIQSAWRQHKLKQVYATETRPLLQGSRLTTWELARSGIDATLLPDSAAGTLIRQDRIQAIITGADCIASNGDTVNKIGTYTLAILAKQHNIPFYVAAPTSTIDMTLSRGDLIKIEQRSPEEVTHFRGDRIAAEKISIYNAAFDLTHADLITAIITERGISRRPHARSLRQLMEPNGY